MNKFKFLVAALLIGVVGMANAMDLKHGLKVTEAGVPMLEMSVTYYGVKKEEYAQILPVENKFLNATEQIGKTAAAQAAKDKNRVSEFEVSLTGSITKDDGKVEELAPIIYDKLTLKDVLKIMRANQTYMSTLINTSDVKASKGQKLWGNK